MAYLASLFHDWTATVTRCGRINCNGPEDQPEGRRCGQNVEVKRMSDRIWLVSLVDYDLGCLDDEAHRLEPIGNLFGRQL